MSCQIKGVANLVDPVDIKNRLLGDSYKKFEHVPANELPLQNCHISLSPTGDILVFAWNTKIVILNARWDSRESDDVKSKFHLVWDGEVTFKQGEWITSVICLPLITLGKASVGSGSDWTCIAVGFNTGFIKFFTETGELLLEEQLHSECVLHIKCQTHSIIKSTGDTVVPEEVHVIYNTVVCMLQGFTLFSTLRACRNHLARVKANCDAKPPVPNLICKKWSLKNQDILNDCEVIGSTSVNTFDHLVTASISGGFNANYRSSAPQHSLVMACGKRPFIGFHYALEGGNVPVLSDVAMAMANKVASALGAAVPSWLKSNTKNSSPNEKVKGLVNEPAEAMLCKFGLCDIMREGDCILVSPNKLLSVICDAMGRVILVDNRQGIALRMWKGYRDAQCGWIETLEERQSSSSRIKSQKERSLRRSALFLVIYGPKKGVIDIWSIQHGAKITTFSASRNGRLLYMNYGLCGLNDVSNASSNKAQHPCIFIDPMGGVKEIIVPFHFALSSHNGHRARDLHLLKKLKSFLKENDFDEEKLVNEITNICLDLKTNEIRMQTIEMLLVNKHITPDALLAATKSFIKQLNLQDDDETDPVAKILYQTIMQLQNLVKFYKYIKTEFDQPPEYNAVATDSVPNTKELSSTMLISEREIFRILKLLENIKNLKNIKQKTTPKVSFKEDSRTFSDFLSCFEFGTTNCVIFQKELSTEKKCRISKIIFQGWMYNNEPISKWQECAKSSGIHPKVLMEFALIYWLNKQEGAPIESELISFTKLTQAICFLNDIEDICGSYNELSSWWKNVYNVLADSQHPTNALTAAIVCRAVAITIQRNKDRLHYNSQDDDCDSSDDECKMKNKSKYLEATQNEKKIPTEEEINLSIQEWENVSKNNCQFSLLVANLEDIAILEAIVSNPPVTDYTTRFYTLPYEALSISLGSILSKGKGSVSEIVARWLSSAGLDPAQLIDTNDIEFNQMYFNNEMSKNANSSDEIVPVQEPYAQRKSVPESIEIANDAVNEPKSDTSLKMILDKLTMLKTAFPYSLTTSVLLANLCWEFVMAWNKDIKQLEALEAALNVIPHIPVKRIRHGVCCLLWNLHVKKRMETTAKLVNKLGRLPKERLCMQDIGLSDSQVVIFLQHCTTFISYFLDAEVLEEEDCSFIKSEELWEGHVGGPLPFSTLAISQSPAWYDLIMLHLQLANVLHMIAHFNLKVTKPINNLFDSLAHQYFFQDITNKAIIPWYKDEKRDNTRVEFLCRVITASMESIHQQTTEVNSYSSTQAILWMSKCQNQACMWKINNDELRIHQVCQLYINGFDRLAEEVVIAVNDSEKLGLSLLPIAGGRMMMYLDKSPDLLEEVSRISPTLTTYLRSLKFDSASTILTNCSNDDTIELVRKVVRFLPETHSDYHKAQLMLDATFIYQDDTSRNKKR